MATTTTTTATSEEILSTTTTPLSQDIMDTETETTTTTTISQETMADNASNKKQTVQQDDDYHGDTGDTAAPISNGANRLLESLWETVKRSLEGSSHSSRRREPASFESKKATSSASSSTKSSSSSSTSAQKTKQNHHGPNDSTRRRILLEQTLRSHYTEQIVASSPWFDSTMSIDSDKDSASMVMLEDQQQQLQLQHSSSTSMHAKLEKPLQWNNQRGHGRAGRDTICYFYCEHWSSHWSYQWCPRYAVYQGQRNNQMTIDVKHRLGYYYYIPPNEFSEMTRKMKQQANNNNDHNDDEDYASFQFYQQVQEQFSTKRNTTTIEFYRRGDICQDSSRSGSATTTTILKPAKRRIAAVVVHSDDSFPSICPTSWTNSLTDPAIQSVQEMTVCQYIVHVCAPTTAKTNKNNENNVKEDDNDDDTLVGTKTSPLPPPLISDEDAQQLNQTINDMQRVIHSHLHLSESERYQRLHPDRTTSLHVGLPPMPPSRIQANLKLIREMFSHAYDGYMYHAYPASQLKPLTCQPGVFNLVRLPALTLIDSMDMLIVLGNYTEFARSVERLKVLHESMIRQDNRIRDNTGASHGGIFALNHNVSVFETNIRVLGGLLSAHQLAEAFAKNKVFQKDVLDKNGKVRWGYSDYYDDHDDENNNDNVCQANSDTIHDQHLFMESSSCFLDCQETKSPKCNSKNETASYWSYDGFLLELAQDIGSRLLPAFDTLTGIPYGTVNLLSGIPKGETTIASLAGGGTLSLEMELLSRLTGDPSYGQAAKLSARALWMRRTDLNLFGKHLCTHRGEWTESLSGIGSNSDSFYEYLIKHHILFPEDQDFWLQAFAAYGGVHNQSRNGEWYADVDMSHGSYAGGRGVFEALMAFYPGLQVLLGELTPAARTLNSFFMVRELLGFLPERFNYGYWKVDGYGGKHHLRPELLESSYFMHRSTKDIYKQSRKAGLAGESSGWQWASDFALHALEKQTRTECGYASVRELSPTTTGAIPTSRSKAKLMNEMPSFFLTETLKYLYLTYDEDNVLHTDKDREWIFTTEAHPIHYISPSDQETPASKLSELKEAVKDSLRRRIRGEQGSSSSPWRSLNREKWTDGSQLRNFIKRMEPVVQEVGEAHISRLKREVLHKEAKHSRSEFLKASSFVEPFLSSDQIFEEFDFLDETQEGTNLAHLTFSKLGHRHLLTKACPNFYASDLLWIRALNGGATDYSDAYMSTAQDEDGESNSNFFMLGAAGALAMHGSGLHVIEVYDELQRCPVVQPVAHQAPASAAQNVPGNVKNGGSADNRKDRFQLGAELGSFDVSAFPGGSGFYIQHVESQETVITTLIEDVADGSPTGQSFVLIYSSPPNPQKTERSPVEASSTGWRLSNRLGGIFHLREDGPEVVNDISERSVVMADLKGNAFFCHIEIMQTAMNPGKIAEGYEEEISTLLARYPCAPALFGPTHMEELVRTGGLEVEAIIQTPQLGDEHGCNKANPDSEDKTTQFSPDRYMAEEDEKQEADDETSDKSCQDSIIQLLHRGICTFQEKSLNQKQSSKVEAVVMINSEPEELFVMSGGGIDGESEDPNLFPVTVLVTGADGEGILRILDANDDDDQDYVNTARISLVQQEATFQSTDKMFSVKDNDFWPAVRGSSEALQIFARGGWGVHALQKDSTSRDGYPEWQLFLMRHQ